MKSIGHISQIWRYPMVSLGGELVAAASVDAKGVVGDRLYGLMDGRTGLPAAPDRDVRWQKALHLMASTVEGAFPTIKFPDGVVMSIDSNGAESSLSDYFGFCVTIGQLWDGGRVDRFPLVGHRHEHFALHVISEGTLRHLANLRGVDTIDVRRFRPNFLVDTREADDFVEETWVNRQLVTRDGKFRVREETTRCGITLISQPGVEKDPDILRTIVKRNRRRLGAYCSVDQPALVRVGDEVALD